MDFYMKKFLKNLVNQCAKSANCSYLFIYFEKKICVILSLKFCNNIILILASYMKHEVTRVYTLIYINIKFFLLYLKLTIRAF